MIWVADLVHTLLFVFGGLLNGSRSVVVVSSSSGGILCYLRSRPPPLFACGGGGPRVRSLDCKDGSRCVD